jgi:GT2 family glycosyltransferase
MKKLISFCINTAVNELEYIKLLLKSLQENLSTLEHEIIVFIDSDNQGTFEWLLEQKLIFPNLKILKNPLSVCYGYARNINEMFEFASNDIVSYLQSDMVVSKNYDLALLKHIKPQTVLSSTRIEPPLHGVGNEKYTEDFGITPQEFKYKEFLEFCEKNKQDKTTNYFFAPFTMYKEVWSNIGGHDTYFRRSREDSDVLNRLILAGNKIEQTWDALVYHFTCVSSRGKDWYNPNNQKAQERATLQKYADQIEMSRFLRKWGSFSHGQPSNYYYNICSKINIDTNDTVLFNFILSYFKTNYINSEEFLEKYKNQDEHYFANELLKFSLKDWDTYSYMYNQENHEDRVKLNNDIDEDIIISFNLSSITSDIVSNFLNNLQHIIHEAEPGKYSYSNTIEIIIKNKLNILSDKIRISNPIIKKEHKYLVY